MVVNTVKTEYRVSSVVMTHPKRITAATTLAELVRTDGICTDPEPDGPPIPLRNAIHAWSMVEPWATHHLVLQDDVRPVDDFMNRVHETVRQHPDAAIIYYANWHSTNGAYVRLAAASGRAWVRTVVDEYTPVPAMLLPREHALGFAEYAVPRSHHFDDDVMNAYLAENNVPTYIVVPNLVEHFGDESIAGGDVYGIRRSACFVPDGGDLPALDTPPLEPVAVCPFLWWRKTTVVSPRPTVGGERYLCVPWWASPGLAQHGPRLTAGFEQHTERHNQDIQPIVGYFDQYYAFELWTSAYLLGAQAATESVMSASRLAIEAALRSMAGSGMESSLRGATPEHVLDSCVRLMRQGFSEGGESVNTVQTPRLGFSKF